MYLVRYSVVLIMYLLYSCEICIRCTLIFEMINPSIEGYSTDGNPKCLKAMKIRAQLPQIQFEDLNDTIESPYKPYFQAKWNIKTPVFIQDTVHIGTKLKTRLLKPGIILPMGEYFVSTSHIENLINNVSKDKYLLCRSHLQSKDKMNFEAADKLCSFKVIDLMKNIPKSEATVQYLLVMRYILDAFLLKNIDVLKRVYYLWYSTFFLRIWRQWIKSNSNYNLTNNFLSLNTYTCIELNAHSLLMLIEKYRCYNTSGLFLPWYFSCQPCEKMFRQARSMTSTFSTVVNFTMLDLLNRVNRMQIINEITTELDLTRYVTCSVSCNFPTLMFYIRRVFFTEGVFRFPREENKRLGNSDGSVTTLNAQIPSTEDIASVIEEAQSHAHKDAAKLKITLDRHLLADTLHRVDISIPETEHDLNDDDNDDGDHFGVNSNIDDTSIQKKDLVLESEEESSDDNKDKTILSSLDTLDLKDCSEKVNCQEDFKNGPFLKIALKNKNRVVVKKSSLCWFFSEKCGRLSSDRIHRVKGMQAQKPRIQQNNTIKSKTNRKSSFTTAVGSVATKKRKKKNTKLLVENRNEKLLHDTDSETECSDDEYTSNGEIESDGVLSSEDSLLDTTDKNFENIECEKYYAIYYDDMWHIGRITELRDSTASKVKFLKADLDTFIWPKSDDIQIVDNNYIFYGPIKMMGSSPFCINRHDHQNINKKYKVLKQKLP